MLAVQHTSPEVLAAYRELYAAAAPPYVFIANAIEPSTAAELRAALAAAGTERFDLADRGRYGWNGSFALPALWEALATLAAGVTGRALALRGARWVHLARGDYALIKDDLRSRPPGALVELTLDLSETTTTDAAMVYAEGERGLEVPQLPHLLALVARSPASTRYDRPLTLRAGGAEVVRLRMWFSELAAAGGAPPPAR